MPATPALLVELPSAAAAPGTPHRRWFTSSQLDLIVWLGADEAIEAFQLCYGKPLNEHSLTWRDGVGYRHQAVDAGDPQGLGHKATPLLTATTPANPAHLRRELARAGARLPPALQRFVDEKLRCYPEPT